MFRRRILLPLLALCALVTLSVQAQDLAERVHMRTLDNGLRVIMVTDDAAPVITFNLMFDVGAIDEPDGLGGLAHMVEHMAFKGTRSIGSADIDAEIDALAELEVLVAAIEQAEDAGLPEEHIAELERQFTEAREHAQSLAISDALSQLFDENGARGLNASTGYDRTAYVVSLPSNRLELYVRVYADVMMDPVFRFFYEERDVVIEERRQRNEDDPSGFLSENFNAAAFNEHHYGRSLIGYSEEIMGYRATEAMAFFRLYYHPNRAVLVMVGDVDPEVDFELIERYFGAVPRGPELRPEIPAEPSQTEEKRITLHYDAEPQLRIGFHKPTYPQRDAYVLDVISGLLSTGRTSRLHRRMVLDERTALSVWTHPAWPGFREDNLFIINAQPRSPHTASELEQAILEELERLKAEPVSERELEKVRNQVRAGFIRNLASSSGLASQLANYELFLGGWENMLDYPDIIDSVTAEEIQEVAERIFISQNRTVAVLEREIDAAEEGTP